MAEMSKIYARPRSRFDNLGHYMTCAYDYLLNYIVPDCASSGPNISPYYLISELDTRQAEYAACTIDQSKGAQERKERFMAYVCVYLS
jgi:hypothetical protein